MKEILFDPLQMNNSTLEYPLPKDKQKHEAMPHDMFGTVRRPLMHPTALAQGGLITTSMDLAKLIIELMKAYNGKSDLILTQEAARELISRYCAIPPGVSFNNDLFPNSMGLGVFIRGNDEYFVFDHFGFNNPGLPCLAAGIPAQGKGIVIMANGANFLDLYQEIIEAISNQYHWKNNPYAQNKTDRITRQSIGLKMQKLIDHGRLAEAVKEYYELKQDYPDEYDFSENQLNALGYHYLENKQYRESIAVFKINTEVFPESANVFDSYAEALMKAGDHENSIANYERSLELNPENHNAIDMLKRLKR